MITQKSVLLRIMLFAGGISGIANAAEYQAYVPVLNVQPIIETGYEPVTRRVCTGPDRSAREYNEVAATIGEDIRHQTRLWQQQRQCRNVTERRTREHIAGYRVTYRYGGQTETIRMSYDPGKQMPVNVSLLPIH